MEDSGVSDEELRKHPISSISPPSETDGENTWVESEPISEKHKEELLDAVRSRRSQNKQSNPNLSDTEYLFDLICKDENERVQGLNKDEEKSAFSSVEDLSASDSVERAKILRRKNTDFYGSSIDYEFIINQIQRNLPTLPTVVNELTNILQNPDSSTFAVEEVMTSDQTMTMKILRVANTSFYRGNRDRVTDASEAVGTLGFEKIRNVILTTSVFKMFSGVKAEEKFSLEGLWKHSLGVAAASRFLANYLGKPWHERAYTCGLVHDIGKVARYKLDEQDNTKQFIKDSQLALDKKINFFKAELINHSPRHDYLGYLICKNWGLSTYVENVVRWHHQPNPELRKKVLSEEAGEVIDLVIIANWAVNHLKFGFGGHDQPDAPSEALMARLNIYPTQVDDILSQIKNELELTEEFCCLMDDG